MGEGLVCKREAGAAGGAGEAGGAPLQPGDPGIHTHIELSASTIKIVRRLSIRRQNLWMTREGPRIKYWKITENPDVPKKVLRLDHAVEFSDLFRKF